MHGQQAATPDPWGDSHFYNREFTPMLSSYEFLASYLRARFGDDERGASLVEYALLVALIAVVCIVAIAFLGRSAKSNFSEIGESISGN
jgi:pilus assembly protein Flp/PilA